MVVLRRKLDSPAADCTCKFEGQIPFITEAKFKHSGIILSPGRSNGLSCCILLDNTRIIGQCLICFLWFAFVTAAGAGLRLLLTAATTSIMRINISDVASAAAGMWRLIQALIYTRRTAEKRYAAVHTCIWSYHRGDCQR